MKPVNPVEPVPSALRAYVKALDPSVLHRLSVSLGVAAVPDLATTAERIAPAVEDPARLLGVVDALPPAVREHLFSMVDAADPWAAGLDDRTLPGHLVPRGDLAVATFSPLLQAGLVGTRLREGRVVVLPGLLPALRASRLRRLAGVGPDSPVPVPTLFLLALVAGYALEDVPKITQGGTIFVPWRRRACERLGHPTVEEARIESLLVYLVNGGLCDIDFEGGSRVVRLDPALVERTLALSPDDLALSFLERSRIDQAARAALGALSRIAAQFPRAPAPTLEDVIATGATLPVITAWDHDQVQGSDAAPAHLARGLSTLAALRLASHAVEGGAPRFRRAAPQPHGSGRWVVQPNFDVLVPEDAPPAAVFRLARAASIASVDHVARFSLTKESVARASASGLSADEILASLAQGASRPVPENVAATIRGWAKGPAVRPFVGTVVVATDPGAQAFLRRSAACLGEIAPGVFRVSSRDFPALVAAATKAGVPVGPVAREDDSTPRTRRTPVDVETKDAADALRKALERWAVKKAPGGNASPSTQIRPDGRSEPLVFGKDRVSNTRWQAPPEAAARPPPPPPPPPPAPAPAREPAPDPVAETPWESLPEGTLRARLRSAVEDDTDLQILYVNGKGEQQVRRITPIEVRYRSRREVLVAQCHETKNECDFLVERIAALRDL